MVDSNLFGAPSTTVCLSGVMILDDHVELFVLFPPFATPTGCIPILIILDNELPGLTYKVPDVWGSC